MKKTAFIFVLFFLIPCMAFASSNIFKKGDHNVHIATAQKKLVALSFKVDRTDGFFSDDTVKAVREFQKKYRKEYALKNNGRLDEKTLQAIDLVLKKGSSLPGNIDEGSKKGNDVVSVAAKYKGIPYKFGGVTTNGFDCSGYTLFVFDKINVKLSRTADTQYKEGLAVAKNKLQKGDLVFFETYEKGASHVGIYAGSGKFWHASTSKGVMLSSLEDQYWKPRYLGARRILKN